MDRHTVTQVVVIAVLAMIVARWLPVGPVGLGFGDPLHSLQTDARLAATEDKDLEKADLMYARHGRPDLIRHWRLMLQRVREMRALAATGEVDRVQLAGIPRNDFWFLTYELYPIPVTGRPYEEGSRHDDPLEPGATRFPEGITEDVDLTRWDLERRAAEAVAAEQRRARRAERER